jgi:hypothetical protein
MMIKTGVAVFRDYGMKLPGTFVGRRGLRASALLQGRGGLFV